MIGRRPIFFDIETTGLRPEKDRIVEIAAIDPDLGREFQTFVNPLIPIPPDATAIHGITDAMVTEAPPFQKAAQEFVRFCEGHVVVIAHNGESFDMPFLAAEFSRNKLLLPSSWAFVDSLRWARKYRSDLPRHALQYLRQMFDISENRAHRALDDVQVLMKVFSLMVDDLSYDDILIMAEGYQTVSLFQKESREQATPSAHYFLF